MSEPAHASRIGVGSDRSVRGDLMHWFWRAAIAVLAATLYGGLSVAPRAAYNVVHHVHDGSWRWLGGQLAGLGVLGALVAGAVAYFIPITALALGSYGLVTRWFGPKGSDGETRCRKCAYILRGLSEPRCPECGERI